MRLFLAEKPSVGREISKYLPGPAKVRDGYIDHGDDIVTWAFGHMLQQAEPGDYHEEYLRWSPKDLPIVPKEWKLLVSKNSAKQFAIIKELLARCDSIVHAGDPDREGQLLIDEILTYLQIDKPVERVLINALDEKSIKDALQKLKNNQEFYNLRQSALARSRADWLIGMNLSRAYTLAARHEGHDVTFPIGRVKTPTLALVVRREEELNVFEPVTYYTIQGTYEHANGQVKAQWKPQDIQKGLDAEDRLLDKKIGEEVIASLMAEPIGHVVAHEKKKKKDLQRLPLSLSALQVLAGKAYGYDPAAVLEGAQNLYEKKLTTYPRSDCDYLPTSQLEDAKTIIENLSRSSSERLSNWAKGADLMIRSKAWNDKKITAHHAIIPTVVPCPFEGLSTIEKHLYEMISQAYIAQFYPVHEYEQTRITIDHNGETFVANGRVVTEMGWKELYRKESKKEEMLASEENSTLGVFKGDSPNDNEQGEDLEDNTYRDTVQVDDSNELPMMKKGDALEALHFELQDKTTKPPSRFTAATLLQAMKEIHKYVKNEDVKKQLKDVSGIGTEATRATIIEDLITRNFIEETGKKKILKPTEKAFLLIHSLPDELSYPDATALWEERLALMTNGEDQLEDFLADQVQFLSALVEKAVGHLKKSLLDGRIGKSCPKCTDGIISLKKGKFGYFLGCSNYPTCSYTAQAEGNIRTNTKGKSSWGDYEIMASTHKTPIILEDSQKQYKCPRCEDGYFLKVEKGRRIQWQCSNGTRCKTTCADVNGVPSFYKNK